MPACLIINHDDGFSFCCFNPIRFTSFARLAKQDGRRYKTKMGACWKTLFHHTHNNQGRIQRKSSLGPMRRRAKRAEKKEGGPGVLPRENFCDHALQIGLKHYFGKRFFDHALEVNTLKVVSYDSKLNNFRAA